jgi:hypothetical protein
MSTCWKLFTAGQPRAEDARCATITFLTGMIQGGASSPRIFIVFINAWLEHLTCTGQALGISHGIEESEQFNNVAFMDDVTVLVQDDEGGQILLDTTHEFEAWSNTKLNLSKTVVVDIERRQTSSTRPCLGKTTWLAFVHTGLFSESFKLSSNASLHWPRLCSCFNTR